MEQPSSPHLLRAQQISHFAQVIAVIALVSLVVTIVVKGGFPLAATLFDAQLPWTGRLHSAGLILISLLPSFLFLEAAMRLREALVHYSNGEFFSDAAAKKVRQAGDLGVQAMVAMILIVPNLQLWVGAGRAGFKMAADPDTIGMLAFTLFVAAVGRVLAAATQLKAENDAFV